MLFSPTPGLVSEGLCAWIGTRTIKPVRQVAGSVVSEVLLCAACVLARCENSVHCQPATTRSQSAKLGLECARACLSVCVRVCVSARQAVCRRANVCSSVRRVRLARAGSRLTWQLQRTHARTHGHTGRARESEGPTQRPWWVGRSLARRKLLAAQHAGQEEEKVWRGGRCS